jgi:hypothetical protein
VPDHDRARARTALAAVALAWGAGCAGADGTTPEDDAARDADGGGEVALFEVEPGDDAQDGGCSAGCTVCGAIDSCGGICQTGACPGTLACDAGACVCAPTGCTTCGADDGCGKRCQTGACPAGLACNAGLCTAATTSYLAPPLPAHFYHPTYGYLDAYPRDQSVAIGAEDPATIVYTTDGSMPGAGSPRKPSPLSIPVVNGTTLKWYADTGLAESPAHAVSIRVDARLQTYYAYAVDSADLGGAGPVVVVAPGATVSGTASWQGWTAPACPGCRYQLIYGVDTTSVGCFYDGAVGVWPGKSVAGSAFSVKAPSTPGAHRLNVTYDLQLSCPGALAQNSLGVRPTQTIGWIVVK